MSLLVVIIAKNEERTLLTLFERVLELKSLLGNTFLLEIAYIDSSDNDKSINHASKFQKDHPHLPMYIYKIDGICNASISRNVGIRQFLNISKCEYILFLDGDIIFEANYVFKSVLYLQNSPSHIGTLTGHLVDTYEIKKFNGNSYPINIPRPPGNSIRHGGNFFTRRKVVNEAGFFDENLFINEDIDYCFRIRNLGYAIEISDDLMGRHYTSSYLNAQRVLYSIFHGHFLSTGLLFRKYILSKRCIDVIYIMAPTLFRLYFWIILLLGLIFWWPLTIISALMYFLVVRKTNRKLNETLFSRTLSFLNGLIFFVGIFLPRRKIKYVVYKK